MTHRQTNGGSAVGVKPSAAMTRLTGDQFDQPYFRQDLEPQQDIQEGEPARLTAFIEPFADTSLYVEWYKDGRQLSAGSRFVTTFDRGYCVLDFIYTIEDDQGSYVCVAQSKSGNAQTQESILRIIPDDVIDYNSQSEILAQTASFSQSEPDQVARSEAPKFVQAVRGGGEVNQGEMTRFEAHVEPHKDTNLTVEWFKDGKALGSGSRFGIIYDRGFALLELAYCLPEDGGIYTCVAHNAAGDTQSNGVELLCHADESVVTRSNLDAVSISHLKQLDAEDDDGIVNEYRYEETVEEDTAPQFVNKLQNMTAVEGGPSKFFVMISGFPKPEITWYINQIQVLSDSIIKYYNDGSISYLEISRCSDVGDSHICVVAENTHGSAQSEAVLTVLPSEFSVPDLKHITPDPYMNPHRKLAGLRKVECSSELNNALRKPKPSAEHIVNMERDVELKGRHAKTADIQQTEKMYGQIGANLRKNGPHASMSNGRPAGNSSNNQPTSNFEFQVDQ